MSNYGPATLAPGIAGLHWRRQGQLDEHVSTPVLSIIELPLNPEIKIHDRTQPVGALWEAVLQYMRTFPGWSAFYWGEIIEKPGTLLLLLQWETITAWRIFQNSLGINLILGLLEANPWNRCLLLELPDLGGQGTFLEAISFTFQVDAPSSVKRDLVDGWVRLAQVTKELAKFTSSGHWLEFDVPNNKSRQAQVKASSQPSVFLGLLAWEEQVYSSPKSRQIGSSESEALLNTLSAQTPLLVSKVTIKLARELRSLTSTSTSQVSTTDSLETLLKMPILRQYKEKTGLWENLDMVAHESVAAFRSRKRLFPQPYGGYTPMGNICQHRTACLPFQMFTENILRQSQFITDVCWFHFPPSASEQAVPAGGLENSFLDLRLGISRHIECQSLICAHNEEIENSVALLVCWKPASSQPSAKAGFFQLLKDFAVSHNLTEPSMQRISTSQNRLYPAHYLELTAFDIPPSQLNRQLFEQAYLSFHHSTYMRNMPAGTPTACNSLFGGWQDEIVLQGDVETMRFTSVLSWQSKAARSEWYQDYARGAAASYERLGHKVDALRTIAKLGAKSSFLVMAPEDILIAKMRH